MSSTFPLAFLSMPGGLEWIVIGIIALLVFGRRLPSVARSLGEAMHEFKAGISGQLEKKEDDSVKKTDGDEEKK